MADYSLVLLEAVRSFDQTYTYQATTPLQIGERVLVPFGAKDEPKEAVVFGEAEAAAATKPIIRKLQVDRLSPELIETLRWAEDYYVAPIGALAKLALPKAVRFDASLRYEILDPTLDETTRQRIGAGVLPGKELTQLVEAGRIARIYSADKKALPSQRFLERGTVESLRQLQDSLSQRQTVVHHVIEELLDQARIPVPGNVTAKHIRLLEAGSDARLVRRPKRPDNNQVVDELPPLSAEQQAIADQLAAGTHLIYGPPASGKTTILIDRIRHTLDQGLQAIVLVPERLLAEALSQRLRQSFVEPIATIHSGLSGGEIRERYHFVAEGDYRIIVGTRNAILAPLKEPGLIAIDDFHDDAFYSDEPPVDFRRLAIRYAAELAIPLILSSSTPDLIYLSDESITKHYLPQSFHPVSRQTHIIDMTTQLVGAKTAWLSRPLEEALDEKSLLFLNRIGYASLVVCRQCGRAIRCPKCQQPMMLHQKQRRLQCRQCGVSQPLPTSCPDCSGASFDYIGLGLEKLRELLELRYPTKHLRQFDSHSLRKKSDQAEVGRWLSQADILLATQILTKGHEIPGLKVVGLLSPDTLLYTPEYRGREKCFQTIIQVGGRVGRTQPGAVYLQTYTPESDVYQLAAKGDIPGFYRLEYRLRQRHRLPPHTHMIKLVVADKTRGDTEAYAQKLTALLKGRFDYTIKGPYSPMFERVGGYYRQALLIQDESTMDDLKDFLRSVRPRRSVRLQVVVDPLITLY